MPDFSPDDQVQLFIEELGDIDDLIVDRTDLIRALEIRQQIRLRDAEIDALEEAHVLDVLAAALPDYRQDAEFVAIVEHRGHVVRDGHIRRVGIARDDRDGIGVDALADAAELWLVRHRRTVALRVRLTGKHEREKRDEKKAKRFPRPRMRPPPINHDLSPFGGSHANATHTNALRLIRKDLTHLTRCALTAAPVSTICPHRTVESCRSLLIVMLEV